MTILKTKIDTWIFDLDNTIIRGDSDRNWGEFLSEQGITGLNPNSKVSHETYMQLLQEFDASKAAKISAQLLAKENELKKAEEIIRLEKEEQEKKIKEEWMIKKTRKYDFLMIICFFTCSVIIKSTIIHLYGHHG